MEQTLAYGSKCCSVMTEKTKVKNIVLKWKSKESLSHQVHSAFETTKSDIEQTE